MVDKEGKDALIIPLSDQEELVVASDNSGSIGMKPLDDVKVAYDVVSYFTFRVAYMDCVAVGAEPIAINVMNFNGDKVWDALIQGIDQGMKELGINNLPITGSTESNFPLQQSAMSITVLGKRKIASERKCNLKEDQLQIAVIGEPMLGDEVIHHKEKIAPLHIFKWFIEQQEVCTVLPVGSKGIAYELSKVWPKSHISFGTNLDVTKSSGPATCFIAIYDKQFHHQVVEKAGQWLHL